MFARVVSTLGKHGGDLGAVDIVTPDAKQMTRDITVRARDAAHQEELVSSVRSLPKVKIINVSDRVFLLIWEVNWGFVIRFLSLRATHYQWPIRRASRACVKPLPLTTGKPGN
jgi:hypothetical protein